ncbi:MAG: ADP-ribosylglycohydrolase family protein, partial [Thermoguttaceae bacterium]
MKNLDQYRGCLLGGAIGDALGYTVEFLSYNKIVQRYGSNGITDFDLSHGQALISDDTQMTLATAFGLLATKVRYKKYAKKANYVEAIGRAYREWYLGQIEEQEGNHWLFGVPGMTDRRAPGN